ncbi:MAG TPA: hypothetical protein VI197_07255 [Polyangiaceae bacterium]
MRHPEPVRDSLLGVLARVFVDVGRALTRIRDAKLYAEEFGTFEAYCRERWGMSKTHANRLIASADVAANVTPIGVIPNEAQARELAKLPTEKQPEAWAKAGPE